LKRTSEMALTPELVALCERTVDDPGPERGECEMSDEDFHRAAARLDRECADRPLWLFAYGSLIWKPAFDPVETRRATAVGWHRSFCISMNRWRGSPEQPGLMMAIMRGGTCHGVAYRLPQEDRTEQIHRMLWRETSYSEDLESVRWIDVDTDDGKVRALTFWAAPKGSYIVKKLGPEDTARRIARACGHIGSNAAYLYNTVSKLAEFGIRDRNLWQLQELVAAEIQVMASERQSATVIPAIV
jgi:glutathione-specific gamma-glutamylcyclotransferase